METAGLAARIVIEIVALVLFIGTVMLWLGIARNLI
jgi:hypothetical protein